MGFWALLIGVATMSSASAIDFEIAGRGMKPKVCLLESRSVLILSTSNLVAYLSS